VTLATRKGKEDGAIEWDHYAAQWDEKLGGALARIAPAVCAESAPDSARSSAPHGLGAQAQEIAARTALAQVQAKRSAWTRAELMKEVGLALPPSSRSMEPAALVQLLGSLTDRTLAGEFEQVVPLEAPQWPALPSWLRRELDGRSVYTRPGVARYATRVQLNMEDQLIATASRERAPHLTMADAARHLGTDVRPLLGRLHQRSAAEMTGCGPRNGSRPLFEAFDFTDSSWWAWEDLNLRPLPYQGSALTV
jgi:hypothetical protein